MGIGLACGKGDEVFIVDRPGDGLIGIRIECIDASILVDEEIPLSMEDDVSKDFWAAACSAASR